MRNQRSSYWRRYSMNSVFRPGKSSIRCTGRPQHWLRLANSISSSHPVLLAVDDAQSLFATSKYVDPSYDPIEAFSLSVPRLLLEYISGAKSFVSCALVSPVRLARPRASLSLLTIPNDLACLRRRRTGVSCSLRLIFRAIPPRLSRPMSNLWTVHFTR